MALVWQVLRRSHRTLASCRWPGHRDGGAAVRHEPAPGLGFADFDYQEDEGGLRVFLTPSVSNTEPLEGPTANDHGVA